VTSIDPDQLRTCLQVLSEVEALPPEHPDAVAVRRATAKIFKELKKERRAAARDKIASADRAVVAATATGAPGRIDDETEGLPLVSTAVGASAGTLLRSRACYICKTHYTVVDAFYHQLCPDCAAFNRAKRDARTDLTGRRALLTGGRAKIGMYIALRLLRDGAHTTITTRFPNDAVRRFAAMGDSADWLHRLRVVGNRPARSGAGGGTGRRGGLAGAAGHPDQQRGPDRAPPAGFVCRAGGGRAHPAAWRWWTWSLSTMSAMPIRTRWQAASPSTRRRTL